MMVKYRHASIIMSMFACTACMVVLTSCTSSHDPSAIKYSYARKPNPYYTVKDGDSLESISKKFSMPIDDIISLNRLSQPYELIPGQKIIVYPKKTPTVFESDGVEVVSNNPEPSPGFMVNPKLATDSEPSGETQLGETNGDQEIQDEATPEKTVSKDLNERSTPAASHTGYQWPVRGKVTNKMKTDSNGKLSGGINIAAPEGTPVYATAEGVVAKSDVTVQGYGKTVIVKHTDGKMSVYSHLKSCTAKEGQQVDPQTIIGRVGKSGGLKKPELHFQISDQQKRYIDPIKLLAD